MSIAAWGQNSVPSTPGSSTPAPSSPVPSDSQERDYSATPGSKPITPHNPTLAPPRSDRVNADDLDNRPGESSSKDSPIDLSPPADDAKAHPESSDILMDAESAPGNGNVGEFHPWNPHKAAKDIEVGDFYFKRKNYRAAEDRYREALLYKENDAVATIRLAVCLEKLDQNDEARKLYESYLKILPHGPQSEEAQKALRRLKGNPASAAATDKMLQ
ncbi:MAG TPA: tetratricopeptide repeat protein [Candidatus Sulfotelmatobacter sp.]|jgi:tetratricopeptide (TPR) repeat protein